MKPIPLLPGNLTHLTACLLLVLSATGRAATLYVDLGNLAPVAPYTNWLTAATNIQDAVNAAAAGDLVLVTNGVYRAGPVTIDKPLALQSVNGYGATRIDGGQLSRCLYLANGAMIRGFTLTNGNDLNGGGAYCTSPNEHILSCLLINNHAGWDGGGAYSGTLKGCVIRNNTAQYVGGGAVNSSLENCTVVGNRVLARGWYGGGVGWHLTSAPSAVNNCILYSNTEAVGNPSNYSDGGNLSYCCTIPLPSGVGNFTNDPGFVGYASGNLQLTTNSLCINTGGNEYVTDSADVVGDPRIVGGVVDVGAYECQTNLPIPVVPSMQATYTSVNTGLVVGFTGRIDGQPKASRWEFGDGTIVSNQLPSISHSWSVPGTYWVALRGYGESFPDGITATIKITVYATSPYHVVPANEHPAWPYSSWATAATNIQTAVNAAYPGSTVLVSNGVYQTGGGVISMSNRLIVVKPVLVKSLNGPEVTTIQGYLATDANNNVRCAYLDKGATLVGFTLTNGHTRAYPPDDDGGGVWCASADVVISNCVFIGNSAVNHGGGIYGRYGGTLYNCKLVGNSAFGGSGAYIATLNSCTIVSNTAIKTGFYDPNGGGVYGGSLNNCTLVGNMAANGGAVIYSTLTNCTLVNNRATMTGGGGTESTFQNCVLYSNAAPNGANYAGSSLSYCCASPLAAGSGNFADAPRFVDYIAGNLRLQADSPCLNTGANAYVGDTTDLDGRPRIVGGSVDVGAFEFQAPGFGEFIAWLQQYRLPTDSSADALDTDCDGMNNWQEWMSGTNPTNGSSVLLAVAPVAGPDGIILTWLSVTNRAYDVERGADLGAPPNFVPLATNIAGLPGMTTYTDATAPTSLPAFYRIRVRP